MRERLRAADRDGDGKVTLEEYKAAFPNVPVERFKALDPDGDGIVDLNNLPQRPPREGREAISSVVFTPQHLRICAALRKLF